jgi:hypothetical protein
VNKTTSKREPGARGRRQPPAANLTGRAGACRILGIEKRQFRRLEDQGVIRPSVVEHDGVRWFDIDELRRLAVAWQRAAKARSRVRVVKTRPEGVERVTGAENRQIYRWFDEERSHAEVVQLSGKTAETIRYLHQQWRTPNGCRLRAPTAHDREAEREPSAYFPERDMLPRARLSGATARQVLARHEAVPTPAVHAAPPPVRAKVIRAVPPVPPDQRTVTHVPDSWFTDELPPLPDDDD